MSGFHPGDRGSIPLRATCFTGRIKFNHVDKPILYRLLCMILPASIFPCIRGINSALEQFLTICT